MNDTALFLIRVWQRNGGFHATVRGVGQDEPMHFDDALPLAQFLLTQAASAPVAPGSTPPGRARGDDDESR